MGDAQISSLGKRHIFGHHHVSLSNTNTMTIEVAGEELVLHPYRALYWPREKALLVADLHLGKIDHFRQAGVYVPQHAAMDNYERLSTLLLEFEVERIILLGDLFHSSLNKDWQHFSEFRNTFSSVRVDLVLGNHDILDPALYLKNDMQIFREALLLEPFSFTHYQEATPGAYNLSGHVHPGVRLRGAPGHSLRLPCFYFAEGNGRLPAFGTFTGTSLVHPKVGDQVIVISDHELVNVTAA